MTPDAYNLTARDIAEQIAAHNSDDFASDLAPLTPADGTTSAPQPGQHHNGALAGWADPETRPAAWRAFGEGR